MLPGGYVLISGDPPLRPGATDEQPGGAPAIKAAHRRHAARGVAIGVEPVAASFVVPRDSAPPPLVAPKVPLSWLPMYRCSVAAPGRDTPANRVLPQRVWGHRGLRPGRRLAGRTGAQRIAEDAAVGGEERRTRVAGDSGTKAIDPESSCAPLFRVNPPAQPPEAAQRCAPPGLAGLGVVQAPRNRLTSPNHKS